MTDANTVTGRIERKLGEGLSPMHLEVLNESENHAVPPGSESHFKVTVVSKRFDGMPTLHRHRLVYGLLAEELAGPVHALALHTYTEEQWRELTVSPCSPLCRGGSKSEARARRETSPAPDPT